MKVDDLVIGVLVVNPDDLEVEWMHHQVRRTPDGGVDTNTSRSGVPLEEAVAQSEEWLGVTELVFRWIDDEGKEWSTQMVTSAFDPEQDTDMLEYGRRIAADELRKMIQQWWDDEQEQG